MLEIIMTIIRIKKVCKNGVIECTKIHTIREFKDVQSSSCKYEIN
jgi:hypothetical protein